MSRPWWFRVVLAVALVGGWLLISSPRDGLVVYCSQDARHADAVFQAFTEATGIPVVPHFDTEATKSMGLVEQLRTEGDGTRADVFWNNQMLGTLDVEHLMQPHGLAGEHVAGDLTQDPEGRWIAFSGRVRGFIQNPARVEAHGGLLEIRLFHPELVAVARPEFGTTRSQLAAGIDQRGIAYGKAALRQLKESATTVVAGNAQVAEAVASGACACGETDSDDFFAVRGGFSAGRDGDAAVTFQPLSVTRWVADGEGWPGETQADDGVLVIPNTVGILAASTRVAAARAFMRFLIGPGGQRILAEGSAKQLPSHPGLWRDPQALPAEVVWLAGQVAPAGRPPSAWPEGAYRWRDPHKAAADVRRLLRQR